MHLEEGEQESRIYFSPHISELRLIDVIYSAASIFLRLDTPILQQSVKLLDQHAYFILQVFVLLYLF